jgi:hypothetical protein
VIDVDSKRRFQTSRIIVVLKQYGAVLTEASINELNTSLQHRMVTHAVWRVRLTDGWQTAAEVRIGADDNVSVVIHHSHTTTEDARRLMGEIAPAINAATKIEKIFREPLPTTQSATESRR